MIEIVKGSTVVISSTVYSTWTGQASTSTVADITGATINAYFKNSEFDADGSAVFTKTGSVVSGPAGTLTVTIAATDTNTLTQKYLVYEIVVKTSGGSYIRSGVDELTMLSNVGKTLF
ncbi:MAG TPA: hypothetical protein PK059_02100 [Cyclobacteriaceae bacterium]|nr:hypothetical protein [Cyclobacteriaceae bacterium]